MSGELEAAGEIITGGIVARAVEPRYGEDAIGTDGLTDEHACLNCGATLTGSDCHACGQQAHIHRSLAAFGHDILHGVFHFEGKIWTTIPLLFWKSGALTNRYIHGERAKSPLALFLFSVFLMFAVFESVGGPVTVQEAPVARTATEQTRKDNLRKTIVSANEVLAALRVQRDEAIRTGQPTANLDAKMEAAAAKLAKAAEETALGGGFALDDLGASADIDTGS